MSRHWILLPSVLMGLSFAMPAKACIHYVQPDHGDVRLADLVVIGRIANYRTVLDPDARRRRQRMLATMSPERRRLYRPQTSFITDYVRFDVLVDQVLVGQAASRLTVTWDNSTFSEPATMPPGPYLIALRRPASATPPLRGPSATISRNREPDALTVLQAPCSAPFLYESDSREAAAIRRIIDRR